MMLTHVAKQATDAFERARLRFVIVKGPAFAKTIYPAVIDRPFTDVDILVHVDDLARANALMAGLGFTGFELENRPADIYAEFKWRWPNPTEILIELHADLVHSPSIRKSASLNYRTLTHDGARDGTEAKAALLVACLHGSLGHQFERLQQLVDVLQAQRNVRRSGCEEAFVQEVKDLGLALPVATALDLAARAFDEDGAAQLANRFGLKPWRSIAAALMSPALIAGAQDSDSSLRSWRRKLYRILLIKGRSWFGI